MIVNINQDWRLRSDELQWILDRRVQPKEDMAETEPTWRVAGYFRFIDEAIMELARQDIRLMRGEYPADALALIVETLDQIREDCRKAVREAITRAKTNPDAPELRVTR